MGASLVFLPNTEVPRPPSPQASGIDILYLLQHVLSVVKSAISPPSSDGFCLSLFMSAFKREDAAHSLPRLLHPPVVMLFSVYRRGTEDRMRCAASLPML